MKYAILAIISISFMGCLLVDGNQNVCTLEARPGITVRVSASDSAAVAGAMVYAHDGSFVDSMRAWQGFASLAHERPGEYEVTVEHEAYPVWRQDGVRVRSGECHVQTVELEAALER